MKRNSFLSFGLFLLIFNWPECICNINHCQDEHSKKILGLIHWLKNTYPESDRAKWDETSDLLINWSMIDTTIKVVVNVDPIEELLKDQKFKYKEESIKIYVLTTIGYCLEKNYDCNVTDAAYMGLLSVIDFYKVIKANNNNIFSESIDDYIRLEEKGKLHGLVRNRI